MKTREHRTATLDEMAQATGLNRDRLRAVVSGECMSHQGWRLAALKTTSRSHHDYEVRTFVHLPSGRRLSCDRYTFKRETGFAARDVGKLISGAFDTYHGWTLDGRALVAGRFGEARTGTHDWIHKDGRTIRASAPDLARIAGRRNSDFCNVIAGRQPSAFGWRLAA
jgi:hypothetical protein